MNVGIIGAGAVGSNIARALVRAGHAVRVGARDTEKYADLGNELGDGVLTNVATAAAHGEVVIFAVPCAAWDGVLAATGDLAGKVVVDASNPLGFDAIGPTHRPPAGFASAAAALADRVPAARVVKAFNTFGAERNVEPIVDGRATDLQMAGDDLAAKELVASLGRDMGLDPVDVGPLRNAVLLENLAILWIHLMAKGGYGRNVGFRLLREES